MFDHSHYYWRVTEELKGNRLDALYNDTEFDVVENRIKNSRFPFVQLMQVVEPLNESRNPQLTPNEEFQYVDIGSIDRVRGVPSPEVMLGKDATSSRMRRVMHEGNLLLSTTRPTRNAICIVADELENQICSTGFSVLQCKPGMLNRFLFYALRSDVSTLQFEQLCSGSGYPAINQETDLPLVRVPKPDPVIQQRIIEAIEPIEAEAIRLDDLASRLSENVENMLLEGLGIQVPQDASRNYFFKSGAEKRTLWFSAFSDEMQDRVHYLFFHPRQRMLGILSSRYTVVSLSEIVRESIIRGEQPIYQEDGDITVLKTVDLKNGRIDYENALKVSEDFFARFPSAHVRKGDILVASTGYVSMGKVDVYDRDEPALVDGHISIVRVKDEYDPHFVAYFLRSYLGQLQFEKWFTGSSGQIELQPSDLGKIVLPKNSDNGISLLQQKQIAEQLTNQIARALALEQRAEAKWHEARKKFEEMIFQT